jgi:hypothetical protein
MAAHVRLSEQLKQALESRAVIDQTIGAIMTQRRCRSEQAFSVLRAASQNRNVRPRTVPAGIVASLQQQAPHRHTDGRPSDGSRAGQRPTVDRLADGHAT